MKLDFDSSINYNTYIDCIGYYSMLLIMGVRVSHLFIHLKQSFILDNLVIECDSFVLTININMIPQKGSQWSNLVGLWKEVEAKL